MPLSATVTQFCATGLKWKAVLRLVCTSGVVFTGLDYQVPNQGLHVLKTCAF